MILAADQGRACADGRYPPLEPYASGLLDVGDGHQVYWEACGNPAGKPALFLHGGPGGGCTPGSRRFFDPARYRIVLFDQRGCGRSQPHARLRANTTVHLMDDIEHLREHLDIDQWLLFGGSWGATLALAYAQAHPRRVSALVLRGVFTARRRELRWLYQDGASHLFPEAWHSFIALVPAHERGGMVEAYHRRLSCGDAALEARAAHAWCAWEEALSTLLPDAGGPWPDPAADLALARIETHYFRHGAFMEEGQLIANAHRLRGIPGVIVQGRHDTVTPAATAWELQRHWPEARLQMVPGAGHASGEAGIASRLVMATDGFAGS
ncbi:MAG: proline iminopeptidase [Massilia sp.]|nr:proline iminopeptidase [Massilia sp.]MDB5791759.1 proline iminopeptidase [Massilia sp.]